MYKCDPCCYDYNNGHICKHIHRVHIIVQSAVHTISNDLPQLQAQPENQDSEEEMDYLSYAESAQGQKEGNNYY